MLQIIFYYLIMPFFFANLVLKFIKKHGASRIPDDVARLLEQNPIEKKFFRAVRRIDGRLEVLGDYEKHEDAVDGAYAGRKEAFGAKLRAIFLVVNDKGEVLDQVDS